MPKLSGLPTNGSPVLADTFVMVQNSGPTDVQVTLQNIVNAVGANNFVPYKFSAAATGGALGGGVFTKIPLSVEDYDTGSNFDSTTNYRFTAPVNGFYSFDAMANTTIAAGSFQITSIFKNGSEYRRGNQFNGNGVASGTGVSKRMQLVAGDYVEFWIFNGGGAANITGSGSQTYADGQFESAL